MGKHYTDRERLDAVKKYRASSLGLSAFAKQEGYNRSTLKDWVAAYNHFFTQQLGIIWMSCHTQVAVYI